MDAMTFFFPDLVRHSPLRPLAWRWQRAQSLVENKRNVSHLRDDDPTRRALGYLRALVECRERCLVPKMIKEQWDIHAAYRLHKGSGPIHLILEARLLAGQSSSEIAKLMGERTEVVYAFESLFFNCRDRLQARDWVQVVAINKRSDGQPETQTAALFKSFAFYGGPIVLEAVLPYLVGDKDPFEPVLDLSTPNGRHEQVIRLAVATHMLPDDKKSCEKLSRMMLLLREIRPLGAISASNDPLLANNLDSLTAEGLFDVTPACVDGPKMPGELVPADEERRIA